MNTKNIHGLVLKIMLLLNFLIVVMISIVSATSIIKISRSMQSRNFLETLSKLPPVPWTIPIYAIGGFLALVILLYQEKILGISQGIMMILVICLGILIIYKLDMNYNGIIFLVSAYLMDYYKRENKRFGIIIIISVCLLVFDFDLCAKFMPIISFNVYAEYYNNMFASVLIACKNFGTTCNMLLFIAYTILLLGEKIDENEKINDLNEKLNTANEELLHANEELEKFAQESQLIAKTKERNRLAREIHDTIGHTLTSIIAGLDAAMAILPISSEETKNQLETIREVARHGMTDVRRSVNELRPDVLEREDLLAAINQTILEISSASNVLIEFNNEIEQMRFNEDEENIIYRIIQESITNSIRHGNATKVVIDLVKEYSIIRLTISDNGYGAKDKEIKYGFGLTHMKERLDMLKGSLTIENENGFKIIATIPIRWGEDND